MLSWKDGERFAIGETGFRTMPPEMLVSGADLGLEEGELFVFKSRELVERYAEMVARLRPQRILELGFFGGGSTLLLAELARPQRLVSIDLRALEDNRERVARAAARSGLGDVVRTYGEVDQADRARLAQIVEDDFDGAPLDLVVDDCSHLYEPSRASFNELFPRLRPGGLYVIEDWPWAHTPVGSEHPEGWLPEETPLTRLLFEVMLALPGLPGLATEIAVDLDYALIRRGEAEVDRASFDVSACSNPRGRAMLSDA